MDAHNDTFLTIAQVLERVEQTRGRRPGRPTIYRWINKGVRGYRLASNWAGGIRMIAVSDLDAFLDACSVDHAAEAAVSTATIVRASRVGHDNDN